MLEQYIARTDVAHTLLKYNCLQKLLELDEYNEQYMFQLLEFLIQQNRKQECIKFFESIEAKLAEIDLLCQKNFIENTTSSYSTFRNDFGKVISVLIVGNNL